ncbi:MAG: aminoglycoside phosphotransferase (APT) family kinase protein [Candidatus Azotimanducaceae bacterium]|jgi:aminoglycoside phosphotransferase (APT) family kinase protein
MTSGEKKDSTRFDEVHLQLMDQQPESITSCIVHNDLKLDNCMFDPEDPDRVQSNFDWDMATLGDPLIELGTLLGYWREQNDEFNRAPTIDLDMSVFPHRSALVERYAQSCIDVSKIDWYEAFALWKHAAVLQQLYSRFESGGSKDERFSRLKEIAGAQLLTAHNA